MNVLDTYHYEVSSEMRNRGTPTDFTITLPEILHLQAKNSVFGIRINECSVPFSFYSMNTNINKINIQITDLLNNTANLILTISVGNYSVLTILTELKTQLLYLCSTLANPFVPVLNFQYDVKTGFMSFTSNNGIFTLLFSQNIPCGKFFGCSNDISFTNNITASSNKTCLTNPQNCLFLRCSTLQQIKNIEYIVQNGAYSDIVYRMPITSNFNNWLHTSKLGNILLVRNDAILNLNFYLTDNLTFSSIDLSGLNFTFSFDILEIQMIIKELREKFNDIKVQNLNKLSTENVNATLPEKNLTENTENLVSNIEIQKNAQNLETKKLELLRKIEYDKLKLKEWT